MYIEDTMYFLIASSPAAPQNCTNSVLPKAAAKDINDGQAPWAIMGACYVIKAIHHFVSFFFFNFNYFKI